MDEILGTLLLIVVTFGIAIAGAFLFGIMENGEFNKVKKN